jgi:hypothetical protein
MLIKKSGIFRDEKMQKFGAKKFAQKYINCLMKKAKEKNPLSNWSRQLKSRRLNFYGVG